MKKKNILNLIKYHCENNDFLFRNEAIEIARFFDKAGDYQLSEYIMGLLEDGNTFVIQDSIVDIKYLQKFDLNNVSSLPLPEQITDDIRGIINAINHNVGINKFLFQGPPGTGKTESVKQLARLLEKDLYIVQISEIIDSKLGQSAKNIMSLFKEINSLQQLQNSVILFDEIDSLAMERINSNDLREMGRATSTLLRELDNLSSKVILIGTTNLFDNFDKALTRRFDMILDFSRYSKQELIEISNLLLEDLLKLFSKSKKNKKIFTKIILMMDNIPYPGEMKNIIKISLAFSDPKNPYDYLKRFFKNTNPDKQISFELLQSNKFTLREIEILTGISKSKLSRDNGASNE